MLPGSFSLHCQPSGVSRVLCDRTTQPGAPDSTGLCLCTRSSHAQYMPGVPHEHKWIPIQQADSELLSA